MTEIPGDVRLIDSDSNGGGVALLMSGQNGKFFVYGVEESDPKKIVDALRGWVKRAAEAAGSPTTNMTVPEEPILPDDGRVSIFARDSLASIVMENDGGIYVNGAFVENDPDLRHALRGVAGRLQSGAR